MRPFLILHSRLQEHLRPDQARRSRQRPRKPAADHTLLAEPFKQPLSRLQNNWESPVLLHINQFQVLHILQRFQRRFFNIGHIFLWILKLRTECFHHRPKAKPDSHVIRLKIICQSRLHLYHCIGGKIVITDINPI